MKTTEDMLGELFNDEGSDEPIDDSDKDPTFEGEKIQESSDEDEDNSDDNRQVSKRLRVRKEAVHCYKVPPNNNNSVT
jgi:hypothetical protein